MKSVFADTSYYIALVNPGDSEHAVAWNFGEHYRGQIRTTEYVLIEVGNWLCRSENRVVFAQLLRNLRNDTQTVILPSKTELFQRGVKLYLERSDKNWSLTDCLSFVVMRDEGIGEALTTDRHFEQAGFKAVLR